MEIQDVVKEIKQSFRQMMDGAVSKSMRDKGVDYKLNWGATLPRLRAKADELKSSGNCYSLAIALWKEDVRECKILATMLMPPDDVLSEVIDIWMEQVTSQEIAEQAAFNLFQYLPYAPEKAYTWIASDKELYQLCGQAIAALQGGSLMVRKAAMSAVQRFAELGLVYERIAKSALKQANLVFL